MQEIFEKQKDELRRTKIIGTSGAGLVNVEMNGQYDVLKLTIDDEVMKEDKEVLEDLIVAAINDGIQKIGKLSKEKMPDFSAFMNQSPFK